MGDSIDTIPSRGRSVWDSTRWARARWDRAWSTRQRRVVDRLVALADELQGHRLDLGLGDPLGDLVDLGVEFGGLADGVGRVGLLRPGAPDVQRREAERRRP